jgi:RNA polymerase sigma factor (TIGR02999 family)
VTRVEPPQGPPDPSSVRDGKGGEITRLLGLWRQGEAAALDRLAPLVYEELKLRAAGYLRGERAGHTLDPTALVHEAFLRLGGLERLDWRCREQFYAVAATTMRRLLVDHARRRAAGKRGADPERVAITVADALAEDRSGERWLDVLDVDRALARLERISERRARVVELRFFAGLEQTEIAALLGISLATVEREWRAARAYLAKALTSTAGAAAP